MSMNSINSVQLIVALNTRATELRIRNGSVIHYWMSTTPAGVELNEAVLEYLKTAHNLLIGRLSAEKIILLLGSAHPPTNMLTMDVRGRHQLSRMPHAVTLTNAEVHQAIDSTLD